MNSYFMQSPGSMATISMLLKLILAPRKWTQPIPNSSSATYPFIIRAVWFCRLSSATVAYHLCIEAYVLQSCLQGNLR